MMMMMMMMMLRKLKKFNLSNVKFPQLTQPFPWSCTTGYSLYVQLY